MAGWQALESSPPVPRAALAQDPFLHAPTIRAQPLAPRTLRFQAGDPLRGRWLSSPIVIDDGSDRHGRFTRFTRP